MSLIPLGSPISEESLRGILKSLEVDLRALETSIRAPGGRVLDPSSLRTAEELLEGTYAVLESPEEEGRASLLRRVNLAYATSLAVIDIVKSHTDVAKVPRRRT